MIRMYYLYDPLYVLVPYLKIIKTNFQTFKLSLTQEIIDCKSFKFFVL